MKGCNVDDEATDARGFQDMVSKARSSHRQQWPKRGQSDHDVIASALSVPAHASSACHPGYEPGFAILYQCTRYVFLDWRYLV